MSVSPLFESLHNAEQDIQGVRSSLIAMKDLALVFPAIREDSPFYSLDRHSKTLRFPPSLASVIYAACHKADDPAYFTVIAEAVTDDIGRLADGGVHNDASKQAGVRHDPETGRIVPYAGQEGWKNAVHEKVGVHDKPDLTKARKTVVGQLNNPERLKAIGDKFGEYLFDLEDHIEDKRTRKALLDDMSEMIKKYRAQYVAELRSSKPISADADGIKRYLEPRRDVKISDAEVYAYIACRMAEKYADDVDINSPSVIQDTVGFVRDWIEGEGVGETSEYQTGEGRSEYRALDMFNNEVDMRGASVAPAYLRPLFAKDCYNFTKKRGGDPDISDADIFRGYSMIAYAFGLKVPETKVPTEEVLDDLRTTINNYVAELARDSRTASGKRDEAIAKLRTLGGDERTLQLKDMVLRRFFQLNPDGKDKVYPGVSGTGDEILLRKTSVAKGEITSRILEAVKKFPNKFKVVGDDKESGKVTVELNGEQVTFDSSSPNDAERYILPVLFPFIDSNSSFTTYTEWMGVVPYSRVVDNRLEFLNDESPELNAARKTEGPDIAGDVIMSAPNKTSAAAITGGSDAFKGEILDRNTTMSTIPAKLANSPALSKLSDGELQAFAMSQNIVNYNASLKTFLHKALSDPETAPALAAYRYAFNDVFGSIRNLLSDVPFEDLEKQVTDKARTYGAIMYNNPELNVLATTDIASAQGFSDLGQLTDANMADVKNLSKEMCTDFIDALEKRNLPQEISDAYGDDVHTKLKTFNVFLQDVATSGMNFIEGYGYQNLNDANTYIGGKYDVGNRMLVNYDAETNEPIGRVGANAARLQRIDQERQVEVDKIKELLDVVSEITMVPGKAEQMSPTERIKYARTMLPSINEEVYRRAASIMNSIPNVDKKYIREVFGAFDDAGREYNRLVQVYACVYASIASIIVNGMVHRAVQPMLMSKLPANFDKLHDADEHIRKFTVNNSGLLHNMDVCRKNVNTLSCDGKLLEPIYNAFRGKSVGDEAERMAYANLLSSAVNVVQSSQNAVQLKNSIAQFFKTAPRDLSKENAETVGLGDVSEDQLATGQEQHGFGEEIAERMGAWKPNGTTYAGMSGHFGLDTVKAGTVDQNSASIKPLTDGESAFDGLDKNALMACADYIQSAKEELAELEERVGATKAEAAKTEVPLFWADDIINVIGSKYMESRLKAELTPASGHPEMTNRSVEEWVSLAKEVIEDLQDRCGVGTILLGGAAAMRYELMNFLTKVPIIGAPPYNYDTVSRISTAFAHIILRVGDMTKTSATPNPLRGIDTPDSTIPGAMQRVAKERMYSKPGEGDDASRRFPSTQSAHYMLNNARDSVTDKNLARSLESLYQDFDMGVNAGARRTLDYFVRTAHDVDNKLHRLDTEINVGLMPNNDAAAIGEKILNAEAANDREYKSVKAAIANLGQDFGEVFERLALTDSIKTGSNAGTSYADMAFGGKSAAFANRAISLIQNPKVTDAFVRAVRYQITDSLLSNRSFDVMRKNEPELMNKVADTFFDLAGNLDGGKTAAICAALDPAERNAAHAAFTENIRNEINADETVGAAYDSDEFAKALTGEYPNREIADKSALKGVVDGIIKPTGKDKDARIASRNAAFDKLQEMAGEDAVDFVKAALNSEAASQVMNSLSVAEQNEVSNLLCDKIITFFGTDPRGVLDRGAKIDSAIAKADAQLSAALHTVLVGRKNASAILGTKTAKFISDLGNDSSMQTPTGIADWLKANGISAANAANLVQIAKAVGPKLAYIKDVEGAEFAKFVEVCRLSLESKGNTSYDLESIKDLMSKLRTSGGGGWYSRLIDYAAKQSQQTGAPTRGAAARRRQRSALGEFERELNGISGNVTGSINAANARTRAVGGNFGTSYVTQANTKSFDSIKNTVRKVLEQYPVPPRSSMTRRDIAQMNDTFEMLKTGTGFEGSVRDFCREVQDGMESQESLAEKYAFNEKNYNRAALKKYLGGSIGALVPEAAKTPNRGSLTAEDIRLIAHSGVPGITMETDADGNDNDRIIIGGGRSMSIDSPVAKMQMSVLVNKAEDKIGGSVFDENGGLTEEGIAALGEVAQGNTAPIDPIVPTERIVPGVIRLVKDSMDSGTGRKWATSDDNGNFTHVFTDGTKNQFAVTFGIPKISSIVNGLFSGKFTDGSQAEFKREIMEYLSHKKKAIPENAILMIEGKVKSDISKVAANMAKKMVADGDTVRSEYGVTVKWLNPPTNNTPPPPVRRRGPVGKKPAPAPEAPTPAPVQPTGNGASAPKKPRAVKKPQAAPTPVPQVPPEVPSHVDEEETV